MTKLTQQQRRDKNKQCKQTHNNSDNHESHEEFISINIKYVYPNVNVINMTPSIQSYTNVISNVKRLNEFTKDDNNIIIIFNINTQMLNTFYSNYMELNKIPMAVLEEVKDDIALMIIRGSTILLYPKDKLDVDTIIQVLKRQFKPTVKECVICFHEFIFNEKRVTCCNCQIPICSECFSTYIKSNSGWCPHCRLHLMYHGLAKLKSNNNMFDDMFDTFVGKEMKTRIQETSAVITAPAKPLLDKFLDLTF